MEKKKERMKWRDKIKRQNGNHPNIESWYWRKRERKKKVLVTMILLVGLFFSFFFKPHPQQILLVLFYDANNQYWKEKNPDYCFLSSYHYGLVIHTYLVELFPLCVYVCVCVSARVCVIACLCTFLQHRRVLAESILNCFPNVFLIFNYYYYYI